MRCLGILAHFQAFEIPVESLIAAVPSSDEPRVKER